MADTKLKGASRRLDNVAVIGHHAGSLAIGTAAESIATAGGTIPANTTRILFIADAAMHWAPVGTPTATVGHALAANEPLVLEHHQLGSKFIKDAGGDANATIVYLR
jgi:hypothetical protein